MSVRTDKWALIPDTHAPYHNHRALKLVNKVLDDWEPYGMAHLGDLGDFYKVSAHSKSPDRRLLFRDECEITREVRAELESKPSLRKKKFIKGNHEFRLESYIADKAPELFGFVDVDSALELSEHGWEITEYRDYTNVGKLNLTHDTAQGGKYTAARAAETFQASVAIGHHHAMQYFVTGDALGERKLGVSFGWLGDADQADYMHRIKARQLWSLGFGIARHERSSGLVHVTPVPILQVGSRLRCCVEGEVYEV